MTRHISQPTPAALADPESESGHPITPGMKLRQCRRFSADPVYVAISLPEQAKSITGEPVVLIDVSSTGLSFLAAPEISIGTKLLVVLAGYGVITGNLDIEILRKQTVKRDLHRYGATIDFGVRGSDEAWVKRRSFEIILRHCQKHGESLAPWR